MTASPDTTSIEPLSTRRELELLRDLQRLANERARDENEQNTLTIAGEGITVKCSQIAGILARRIVCWKREGDRVECGERFGMIKFGSRTDVILPGTVEIVVKEGMHVRGGVTIIGKISE